MPIDRNANSPLRHRRNAQRLGDNELLPSVSSPLVITGSTISLNISTSGGLYDSSGLAIKLDSTSLVTSASGAKVNLRTLSGLFVSSGLGIQLVDTSLVIAAGGIGVNLASSPGLEIVSGLKVKLNSTSLSLGAAGLSISSADFGDITTSVNGTVWTIDNNVVTFAKMQDITTDTLIGRATAGTGDPELITLTAAGRALIDDASASAQRTTLGLGTGDSPQFTAIEVGAATDTTVSRASAGDIQVEGNRIFRVGGADVPVADGGTGASTANGALTNLLPSQTGNAGRVLTTDGTNTAWSASAGSAQFTWLFNTNTTGDPGTGKFLFNAGHTTISISKTDNDGNTITSWMDEWDENAPFTIYGYLIIRSKSLNNRINILKISSSPTDNTSYYTFTVVNVHYPASFASNDVFSIEFVQGPSPIDNDSLQLSSNKAQVKKFRDVTSFATFVAGEVAYNTSTKRPFIAQTADVAKSVSGLVYIIDTNSADIVNVASGTFTSGTYTFAANYFTQLQTIRVRAGFKYSTTGTPTLTLTLRIGGQTVVSLAQAPSAAATNRRVVIEAILTCRATGASGSFGRSGWAHWELSSTAGDVNTTPIASSALITGVDTTSTITVDATAAWGVTDPANTVTMVDFAIEAL